MKDGVSAIKLVVECQDGAKSKCRLVEGVECKWNKG